MMTPLTLLIIRNDPRVYASATAPVEGKFGLCIGTYEKGPSGHQRIRELLTSQPHFRTAEAATAAAEKVIAEVRGGQAGA